MSEAPGTGRRRQKEGGQPRDRGGFDFGMLYSSYQRRPFPGQNVLASQTLMYGFSNGLVQDFELCFPSIRRRSRHTQGP